MLSDVRAELGPGRGGADPEVGGEHDLAADRGQSLADQALVVAGGVALGSVVEGAAKVERGLDQVDRFRFIHPGSVAVAEPHGPQPDGGDLQALSEDACTHEDLLHGSDRSGQAVHTGGLPRRQRSIIEAHVSSGREVPL